MNFRRSLCSAAALSLFVPFTAGAHFKLLEPASALVTFFSAFDTTTEYRPASEKCGCASTIWSLVAPA